VREEWGLAEDLPDFARALALWSSPALATKHKALASELFERVGILPLSQGGHDVQMSQMLSLLDMATASCAAESRNDLLDSVAQLWKGAYREWDTINNQWATAAETLAKAVTADGPERAQFLADPSFEQSYCRRLIDQPLASDHRTA
jgi:hypothetical protein